MRRGIVLLIGLALALFLTHDSAFGRGRTRAPRGSWVNTSNTSAPVVPSWAEVGRLTPVPDGSDYEPSEGPPSSFDFARTTYGYDLPLANTNEQTSWPRIDHSAALAGAGVTMGMDVGDAGSRLFLISDGFEVRGSMQNMASGLAAGMSGGIILNRGLGSFPFGDIALQANTIMLGVRPATGASDFVCIAVSGAGAITSVTLAGARTNDRLDYVISAPPGGGSVTMSLRNASTAATAECTITTNLPTLALGLITHANNGASGGTVNQVIGSMVWGRGPVADTTVARMPQAFEGVAYESWMAGIAPADLQAAYLAALTARATQWDFGLGPDGATGIAGLYGTRALSMTGLPFWNLALSTTNGTDGTFGDFVRLTSSSAFDQPAGLPLIPPDPAFVRGTTPNVLIAARGFFVEAITRRTGAANLGTRGLVLGIGSGPFGDPTAEVSNFPGVAFEYDSGDAVASGVFLHHSATVGGATRTSLASAGGVRTDGVVYRAAFLSVGDGRIGAILYRVGVGIVYTGWLDTNIPAAGAPMFPEVNASPCDDSDPGPCDIQTLDIFAFRGTIRGN